MLSPFTPQTITLTQESIDFARWEGTELFEHSRNLRPDDTVETKIRNSLVGAFGQQVMVEEVGARRVSKEECPNFAYDVVCNHYFLGEWAGYYDPSITSKVARVEVKTLGLESGRKWISFNRKNIAHALKCARLRQFDYMTFFGIADLNLEEHTATVDFLGIIPVRAVANDRLWKTSKFKPDMIYINHHDVNDGEYGSIFL